MRQTARSPSGTSDALFLVRELGGYGLPLGELAVESVEGVETVLGEADLGFLDEGLLSSGVRRLEGLHREVGGARWRGGHRGLRATSVKCSTAGERQKGMRRSTLATGAVLIGRSRVRRQSTRTFARRSDEKKIES